MSKNINVRNLDNKNIDELSLQELIAIHLNTNIEPITVKNAKLKSTLSFLCQNINHSLAFENGKHIAPYISLCAILDQLGICYSRTDKNSPRYNNGIKKRLVYFSDLNEGDETIDVIYAFRNGLMHNISLTCKSKYNNKYYIFNFDDTIESLYKKSKSDWDGSYETLNGNREEYTTYINIEKFKELVFNCIAKAEELNDKSLLSLNLEGGKVQLFYDYIRSIPII